MGYGPPLEVALLFLVIWKRKDYTWNNPSAWSDKVAWITEHLDDVFHKKMVITHCKHLCKGDYLIDDRDKNGAAEFEGELIRYGSDKFPDWDSVLKCLL